MAHSSKYYKSLCMHAQLHIISPALILLLESNVLIRVPDSCKCQDILHCTCHKDQKCEVKLADFDSMKKRQHRRDPCTLPYVECQPKSPEKVKGTPGYRAVEV